MLNMRRVMYRIHKWLAVTAGVFFVIWLLSGIVMVLPRTSPPNSIGGTRAQVNFASITMSPAEAISKLTNSSGHPPQVKRVGIIKIHNSVAYKIDTRTGNSHLINAQTGEIFHITQELAIQIARTHRSLPDSVTQVDYITHHTSVYPWGALPTYRFTFDDSNSTIAYVSPTNGDVRFSNTLSRIRTAITSLHEFIPLKLLIDSEVIRKGLLILVSLVGICAAASGYYLAFRGKKVS